MIVDGQHPIEFTGDSDNRTPQHIGNAFRLGISEQAHFHPGPVSFEIFRANLYTRNGSASLPWAP